MFRYTASLSLATGLLSGAVVIDRVAVIAGKRVIKLSDIRRDLRLTQFMNREPVNFSVTARRQAAERLVDQAIIRNEIARGGYQRPADSEAAELLNQLKRDRFGGADVRMREELARYGLLEDQLREQLLWQITVLRFIDQRFRAGVLVTDEEVRAYYDSHLADLKREYPRENSFEELTPKIRSVLEGERINQNFGNWLEEARKRNPVEYRPEAFE